MVTGEAYFRRNSDASVSAHAFLLGVVCCAPSLLCSLALWQRLLLTAGCCGAIGCLLLLLLPVRSFPNYAANGKRALLLGGAFACGLVQLTGSQAYWQFGLYFCFLSAFHWSEYFVTAVTNPATLRISSYMLDHSLEYHIAALVSWVEFWLEVLLLPYSKVCLPLLLTGVLLCACGEAIRKLAMVTAGTNFNHVIEHKKRLDHALVTTGVYSLARHPSYTGWFMWAVGTQLILCNPVSCVGYAIVTWRFFRDRILDEERLLINFFNQEYLAYQRSTWSGIPFVRGYFIDV